MIVYQLTCDRKAWIVCYGGEPSLHMICTIHTWNNEFKEGKNQTLESCKTFMPVLEFQ